MHLSAEGAVVLHGVGTHLLAYICMFTLLLAWLVKALCTLSAVTSAPSGHSVIACSLLACIQCLHTVVLSSWPAAIVAAAKTVQQLQWYVCQQKWYVLSQRIGLHIAVALCQLCLKYGCSGQGRQDAQSRVLS
jgi:hypothetical protein